MGWRFGRRLRADRGGGAGWSPSAGATPPQLGGQPCGPAMTKASVISWLRRGPPAGALPVRLTSMYRPITDS
ncbi:MAG TPA: hypothetical protein VHX88_21540 [Solirubrobacteraceae bacterium]|jgi:hypothetical protein|nr:hypothetical protein [Solirubrobacteraceae bacterium]